MPVFTRDQKKATYVIELDYSLAIIAPSGDEATYLLVRPRIHVICRTSKEVKEITFKCLHQLFFVSECRYVCSLNMCRYYIVV